MNATNPYAPPTAQVVEVAEPLGSGGAVPMAGRGIRLAAAMIDLVLLMALILLPFVFVGAGSLLLARGDVQTASGAAATAALVVGVLFLVWCIVTAVLVARFAQTIGKRMLGIKVALPDGARAGFWRILILRNVLPGFLSFIAGMVLVYAFGMAPGLQQAMASRVYNLEQVLWFLVDSLFILGAAQRCVHDYFAGTIVIRAR